MSSDVAEGALMTSDEAVALIEAASSPAELFGSAPGRQYRRLALLTHPDTCPGDRRAADAFAKLTALWRWQTSGGRPGPGGRGPGFGHGAPLRRVAQGDIANLYLSGGGPAGGGFGGAPAGGGLLKLVRNPADNDLMDREAVALSWLRAHGDRRYLAYVPWLIEAQRHQDPSSGVVRRANLIGLLDGFVSLADVRRAYPGGVDPRDAAWMWRRLLVAVGLAHRAGVVHAAVLPEHVLVHPAEHGLVLVDWCYAAGWPAGPGGPGGLGGPGGPGLASPVPRGPVPAIVGRYRDWYPPEVLARQAPGPDLDIYLATRCMTDLVGGRAPARMAAFAAGCTLRSPRGRPQDAWALLGEFDELLERLYGPRTFRPFAMPAQRVAAQGVRPRRR